MKAKRLPCGGLTRDVNVRAWAIAIMRAKIRGRQWTLRQRIKRDNFLLYYVPYVREKLWFESEIVNARQHVAAHP